MKVALYYTWIHSRGGGEKVLLKLLEKSDHDITIFTNNYRPEDTYDEFQEHDVRVKGNLPVVGEMFRGLSFAAAAALTDLPLEEYDALIASGTGIQEMITFRNQSVPTIGFSQSPLRAVHDDAIVNHKLENYGFVRRQLYRLARAVYTSMERPAWDNFDHVVFNSETTRNRALNADLIERERTSVAYPGVETSGNEPGAYEPYFFYPSRFAYYKRQELAVDAFSVFRERNPDTDYRLVVAGGVNAEKEPYFREIKSMASEVDGVEVRRDVPGEEWKDLYRNCYATLFTAMNEDWGMVPIEAGSYEKPVISVDEGGPTESIIDGETGFLVDSTPQAFADKMGTLVERPALVREMGERGRTESSRYTWDRFVREIDRTVERVTRDESKGEIRRGARPAR